MKLMILTLAICLAGCTPHYFELSPYAGQSTFDRPVNDFETVGLMFTVGWAPQQRAHETRMENLAVAHLASDKGVTVRAIQDAMNGDASEDEHVPFVPDVPETAEDRWNVLTYALMLLIIACAAWIFKRAGVGLPGRKAKDE